MANGKSQFFVDGKSIKLSICMRKYCLSSQFVAVRNVYCGRRMFLVFSETFGNTVLPQQTKSACQCNCSVSSFDRKSFSTRTLLLTPHENYAKRPCYAGGIEKSAKQSLCDFHTRVFLKTQTQTDRPLLRFFNFSCLVWKEKHLICFQSEASVFKFL